MSSSHICARCGQPFPCPSPSACEGETRPTFSCPSCVETAPNVVRQSDGMIMVYPDDFPRERMVGVPLEAQKLQQEMGQK